jgi:hypothetical protein
MKAHPQVHKSGVMIELARWITLLLASYVLTWTFFKA